MLQSYTRQFLNTKKMLFQMCTKYDIYFELDSSLIQRQFCFKPIPDISYSSNKISKKYIYLFLATIINSLKKKHNKI